MNDRPENNDQKQDGSDTSGANQPTKRAGAVRIVLRVAVVSLAGFFAVAALHQMMYEPRTSDGTYEWTLRWPGTPPGAKFSSEPGDDTRRLLELLVVDAGADWQTPLAESGSVEIALSHPAYPSLWTILKWRFGWLKDPQGLVAERMLLTARIDTLSGQPSRYEVTRIGTGGAETVTGAFDSYTEAEHAVLDQLAQAMDDYQT
jgi:hypothetical protein